MEINLNIDNKNVNINLQEVQQYVKKEDKEIIQCLLNDFLFGYYELAEGVAFTDSDLPYDLKIIKITNEVICLKAVLADRSYLY